VAARCKIEALYRCEIGTGGRLSIAMPKATLEIPSGHARALEADGTSAEVPDWHDIQGCVRELIRLGLLKRRPPRRWVAAHLGLSVRTMQRHLSQQQVSYRTMLRDTILEQAQEMLLRSFSITAIALELGYSDAAHLSRAFRRQGPLLGQNFTTPYSRSWPDSAGGGQTGSSRARTSEVPFICKSWFRCSCT
jgi:AraC-like DNA-binding protein